MNWFFIFKTSFVSFGIMLLICLAYRMIYSFPNELFDLASFIQAQLFAGIYVYQNSDQRQIIQGIIAALFFPVLFFFFMVFVGISWNYM